MSDSTDDEQDQASDLGKHLLGMVLGMLDGWADKNESEQQAAVVDLREEVTKIMREAIRAAFAGDYPACQATLEGATVKNQITARITISKAAISRHEILDAVGSTVTLVVANPDAYLAGIKDVRARAKQRDMFPEQKPLNIPGLDTEPGSDQNTDSPLPPQDPDDALEDNWVAESFSVEKNVVNGHTRVSTKQLAEQLVDELADFNARTDMQSIGFNAEEIRKQDRGDILVGLHWLHAYIENDDYGPPGRVPDFLHPPASR